MKKNIVIIVVIVVIALSFVPIFVQEMSKEAWQTGQAKPVKELIEVQIYKIFAFAGAKSNSEKAIVHFADSKYLPFFLYAAVYSSSVEGKFEAAQYWMDRLNELYPDTRFSEKAQAEMERLKK